MINQLRSLTASLGKIEGLPVALVLLFLYAAFYFAAPQAYGNFQIYASFLQTVPKYLICALGLTFVIAAGEIDLSFPAIIAFSGFVFTWVYKHNDPSWSPWLALVVALLAGALAGFINGTLIAKVGVPSIVMTLAAQFFWNGATVLLADGKTVPIIAIRDHVFHAIMVGRLFGFIPAQALWTLLLAIVLWFILNRHQFGEAVLFIGDNANVARVMGINVEATKIKLFTMNGIIAAFSGVIVTTDINTFFPTQGGGFLLPALAGVFIGGTSVAGGQGAIIGTLFGSFIIGSLEGGVVSSGISGYWVQLVEGVVMGTAVVLNISLAEGRTAIILNRLRQWSVPARADISGEASPQSDEAAD